MDIGNCCICLSGFNAAQMGVLPCLHTFHHSCIARALGQRALCPLCRKRATVAQIVRPQQNGGERVPGELPKEAMRVALNYYDRTIRQFSTAGTLADGAQREELQFCLNSLLSTLDSAEAEREAQWERLKQFLKVCGMAAVFAVLAFLFTLYWPMFSFLAGRVVRTVWTLITSLRDLLVAYWPDLLFGGLLITTFVGTSEADSQVEEENANAAGEEQQ